jgi:hypothetical protein
MLAGVEIRAWSQERQVRLGLGVVVEHDGILDADDDCIAEGA